jgi:hypothetical protein
MRGRAADKVTQEIITDAQKISWQLNRLVEDAKRRTTPTQHGYVVPLPDGKRAKCGGPAGCEYCRDEQDRHDLELLARLLEQNGLKRTAGLSGLLEKLGVES